MNKFCLICFSAACLSFFSSCTKNDVENHNIVIEYPYNNIRIMYADHAEDSIVFQTFDSYVTSPYNSDWITVTAGSSYDVTYDPYNLYYFKSLLSFTPNTTGQTRYGYVRVDSYGKNVVAAYVQLGFLNITHPAPVYPASSSVIPDSAVFELQASADQQADSLCFTVAQPWTLSFPAGADQSWLTPDKTSGKKGHNNIAVSIAANTGSEQRTTSLVLNSGGVENVITVIQLPATQGNNQ